MTTSPGGMVGYSAGHEPETTPDLTHRKNRRFADLLINNVKQAGGGGLKAQATGTPNDGGNRFYVSTKFAFPARLGKHPMQSAFRGEEIPLSSRELIQCQSMTPADQWRFSEKQKPSGGSNGGLAEARNNKAPNYGALRYISGGERGIRTLDTRLTYTHFPGVLLQPLGHLSGSRSQATLLPRRANVSKRRRFGKPFFHCFQPLVAVTAADSPVMN